MTHNIINENEYFIFRRNDLAVGDIVTVVSTEDQRMIFNQNTEQDIYRYRLPRFTVPGNLQPDMERLSGTELRVTRINEPLSSGTRWSVYVNKETYLNHKPEDFCRTTVYLEMANQAKSNSELNWILEDYRFNRSMLKKIKIIHVESKELSFLAGYKLNDIFKGEII